MAQAPAELYADLTFGGAVAKLQYGRYPMINQAGISEDDVTSIKVAAFTRVTLFSDRNFLGESLSIFGPAEISDLRNYQGGFNDVTSSVMVDRIEPTLDMKMNCCQGQLGALCVASMPRAAKCAPR